VQDADNPHAIKFQLLKVELTSDKAVNSPKTFYSDASSLVTPPSPGSMAAGDLNDLLSETLVIDYDQVLNAEGEVEDFYVEMSVPSSIGASVNWALTETPGGSAQITNASSTTTRLEFDSASRGGLYRIELTIGGSVTLEGRVWLPVAGPAIDAAFNAEVSQINTWGALYRAQLADVRVPNIKAQSAIHSLMPNDAVAFLVGISDIESFGRRLDWYGAPAESNTPSGGPVNGLSEEARTTIGGGVIPWPKRNNILYAVVGRNMGISETLLNRGPNAVGGEDNTPDGPEELASYAMGFGLFNGSSISDMVDTYGRSIYGTDSWPRREFPSYETNSSSDSIWLRSDTQQQLHNLTVWLGF
ncbi:MAG: hypothetical protein ACLFS1_10980, partial [Opitutales bacterium]